MFIAHVKSIRSTRLTARLKSLMSSRAVVFIIVWRSWSHGENWLKLTVCMLTSLSRAVATSLCGRPWNDVPSSAYSPRRASLCSTISPYFAFSRSKTATTPSRPSCIGDASIHENSTSSAFANSPACLHRLADEATAAMAGEASVRAFSLRRPWKKRLV